MHIYVKQTPPALLSLPPSLSSASTLKDQYSNSISHSIASAKDIGCKAEYEVEERLLHEVVEEILAQGVIVTRAKRLKWWAAIEHQETGKAVGVEECVGWF